MTRLHEFTDKTLARSACAVICHDMLVPLVLFVAIFYSLPPANARTMYVEGDYGFNVFGNRATIVEFNASYTGSVKMTNMLNNVPVTTIEKRAFFNCKQITSITISENVQDIHSEAFPQNSTVFTNIDVVASNELLSSDQGVLFVGIKKAKNRLLTYPCGKKANSYSVPQGVEYIDGCSFNACRELTCVFIPNSVKSIESGAFWACPRLARVIVEDRPHFGPSVFKDCPSLKEIYFKGDVPCDDADHPVLFADDINQIKVFYLSGKTGWKKTFCNCRTQAVPITAFPVAPITLADQNQLSRQARESEEHSQDTVNKTTDQTVSFPADRKSGPEGAEERSEAKKIVSQNSEYFAQGVLRIERKAVADRKQWVEVYKDRLHKLEYEKQYDADSLMALQQEKLRFKNAPRIPVEHLEDKPSVVRQLYEDVNKYISEVEAKRIHDNHELVNNYIKALAEMRSNTELRLQKSDLELIDAELFRIKAFLSGERGSVMATPSSITTAPVPVDMIQVSAQTLFWGSTYNRYKQVSIDSFYIDKYEVTWKKWSEVWVWARKHGYTFNKAGKADSDNIPVSGVTWYDCVKWCNARSEKEGRKPVYFTNSSRTEPYRTGQLDLSNDCVEWGRQGYRLPTEAEWRCAACAGSCPPYLWGTNLSYRLANYASDPKLPKNDPNFDANSREHPVYLGHKSPVGEFPPNAIGLFDMIGNVSEWCWNFNYESDYQRLNQRVDNPRGPDTGQGRASRGGAYNNTENYCTPYITSFHRPFDSSDNLGFRAVMSCKTSSSQAKGPGAGRKTEF